MSEWSGVVDLEAEEASLIDQISAQERAKSAAAAAQAALTAALVARRDSAEDKAGLAARKGRAGLGAEVALARRESPNLGNRLMGLALVLVHEMPHTFAALSTGALSEWRATLIVRESACLTLEDRARLDEELCADPSKLTGWGNDRVAKEAKKIAYRLDPQAVVERVAKAPEERFVSIRPAPDCMAKLTLLLPVAQGVAAYAALKRTADVTFDGRTRDQVMADTAYERLTGQAAATPASVDVGVVITDKALLAGDDEPAELTGYGPIPAEIGRRLIEDALADECARATLRRLYRHPKSGALIAMESRARLFPPGLARFIRTRDRTCRTPYCNAQIRHIDHVQSDADGGKTTAVNGQGYCAQCNYTKEANGWSVVASVDRDGTHTTTVTTPTGHTHQSQAPPLPG